MDIADIKELHFITDIKNAPTILRDGILSHNRACKVNHCSIAEHGVQERRKNKKIPGTTKYLHDYANLYFDAHNPMLSARRDMNDKICVLRVKNDILSLDDVIVTDQNASRACWFKPVSTGLPLLNKDEVFAEFWVNRSDPMEEYRLKGIKCAEVLVPVCIKPAYIFAAFVANETALNAFKKTSSLSVEINRGVFF